MSRRGWALSLALAAGVGLPGCYTHCRDEGTLQERCQVLAAGPARLDFPPVAALALVPLDPTQVAPDVLYPEGVLELDGSGSHGEVATYTWAIEDAGGAPAAELMAGCTESADHLHLRCNLPGYGASATDSPVGAYVAKLTLARSQGRDPSTATVGFRIAERSRDPAGVAGVRAAFTVCAVGDARRCCGDPAAPPVLPQGAEVVYTSDSVPAGRLEHRWTVGVPEAGGLQATVPLGTGEYGFYTVPVVRPEAAVVLPWTLMVTERGTGTRHLLTVPCTFGPAEPAPPPPPPPGDASFFVTAAVSSGRLGGLAGADARCQAAAEASSHLPASAKARTWRAFLSLTATWQGSPPAPDGAWVHAAERIGSGPWRDPAGQLVAAEPAALVAAGIPQASMLDEEGRVLAGTSRVWTGTLPSGRSETEQENDFRSFGFTQGACLGWTGDSAFAHAGAGVWDGSGSWVRDGLVGCEQLAHLYCFAE